MASPNGHSRVCPTRIDGAAALFSHRVSVEQCQDRQRGRYHKCFTCAHNNAYVAIHGAHQPAAPEDVALEPEEAAVAADREAAKAS